jgi:hypothetical protein
VRIDGSEHHWFEDAARCARCWRSFTTPPAA